MAGKNSIPDRWLPYTAVGKPIGSTRFVAFKVPLKEAINRRVSPSERFGLEDLVEKLPQLKAVIDLTNTYRYYNRSEMEALGIKHIKLECRGREMPPRSLVDRFFQEVDTFLADPSYATDALIGVHCTHGVNRTGFFICKYMIEKMKFEPTEAINLFNEARGHKMEREIYLSSLRSTNSTRYNDQPDMSSNYGSQHSNQVGRDQNRDQNRNVSRSNYGNWRPENRGTTNFQPDNDRYRNESGTNRGSYGRTAEYGNRYDSSGNSRYRNPHTNPDFYNRYNNRTQNLGQNPDYNPYLDRSNGQPRYPNQYPSHPNQYPGHP